MPPNSVVVNPVVTADADVPHKAETLAIRAAITEDEKRVRARYPWLRHQDALALAIWACSLAVIVVSIVGYARGVVPLLVTFPLVAFAASMLHELEHDLIHQLYFRKNAWVHNVMLFGIWIAKLSLDPWYRRDLHLLHHKSSGQIEDIEEQFLVCFAVMTSFFVHICL